MLGPHTSAMSLWKGSTLRPLKATWQHYATMRCHMMLGVLTSPWLCMFQFHMISYWKTKGANQGKNLSGHCTFQVHLVQCFNNCQILPSDWVTFYLVDWYKWHFSTGLVESGSCHLEYESVAWTKLVVERDLNLGQAFCMRWRTNSTKMENIYI